MAKEGRLLREGLERLCWTVTRSSSPFFPSRLLPLTMATANDPDGMECESLEAFRAAVRAVPLDHKVLRKNWDHFLKVLAIFIPVGALTKTPYVRIEEFQDAWDEIGPPAHPAPLSLVSILKRMQN